MVRVQGGIKCLVKRVDVKTRSSLVSRLKERSHCMPGSEEEQDRGKEEEKS